MFFVSCVVWNIGFPKKKISFKNAKEKRDVYWYYSLHSEMDKF